MSAAAAARPQLRVFSWPGVGAFYGVVASLLHLGACAWALTVRYGGTSARGANWFEAREASLGPLDAGERYVASLEAVASMLFSGLAGAPATTAAEMGFAAVAPLVGLALTVTAVV